MVPPVELPLEPELPDPVVSDEEPDEPELPEDEPPIEPLEPVSEDEPVEPDEEPPIEPEDPEPEEPFGITSICVTCALEPAPEKLART